MRKQSKSKSNQSRVAGKHVSHPLTVTRQALLIDGSDAAFRRFLHNFLAFSGRVETIRNAFGKLVGLSGVRYSVLISVFHLQDAQGVAIGAVAEHLHLGLATLTVETNKLVELGLVTKQNDPADRRRVLLKLSRQGERLLVELAPTQQQINDELFLALSRRDFENMAAQFQELVACGDRAVSKLRGFARDDSTAASAIVARRAAVRRPQRLKITAR